MYKVNSILLTGEVPIQNAEHFIKAKASDTIPKKSNFNHVKKKTYIFNYYTADSYTVAY